MGDPYTLDTLHHPPPLNIGVVQTNFPEVNPWGGGAGPSGFPLAPLVPAVDPPTGAQWTLAQINLFSAVVHVPGGAGLPGFYQTQLDEHNDGNWNNPDPIQAVGDDETGGPFVGILAMRVRWCNATDSISDWSASKTLTIS